MPLGHLSGYLVLRNSKQGIDLERGCSVIVIDVFNKTVSFNQRGG